MEKQRRKKPQSGRFTHLTEDQLNNYEEPMNHESEKLEELMNIF